jgi:hypothetical protein
MERHSHVVSTAFTLEAEPEARANTCGGAMVFQKKWVVRFFSTSSARKFDVQVVGIVPPSIT